VTIVEEDGMTTERDGKVGIEVVVHHSITGHLLLHGTIQFQGNKEKKYCLIIDLNHLSSRNQVHIIEMITGVDQKEIQLKEVDRETVVYPD
jgi:hypothetical protein